MTNEIRRAADFAGSAPILALLSASTVALVLACAPQEPSDPGPAPSPAPSASPASAPGQLQAVPEPDLSSSEAGVRDQIAEFKAKVDEVMAQPASTAADRAQAFGELGLRYLIYDFLDAAAVCFSNARSLEPEDFRWIYLGGYLHKIQGRLDPAMELFETTLELRADFLPAVVRLARSHLELGDVARAHQLFERALELEPESAAALEGLGKLASGEGDAAAAAAYFEKALALAPEASSLHYALGQAYRNAGNLEKARFHLERRGDAAVRVIDPLLNPLADLGAGSQFYVLRGQEAMEQKDYTTAAASFERALEASDDDFMIYQALAYAVEKLGNLDGAIEHLETALEKATTGDAEADRRERADVHRVLGGLEALRGDDEAAIRHFTSSLGLEADQAGVRMKLANALARVRRFEEAVGHYDQLLAAHPELAGDLYVRRATVLVNLRRVDDAVEDFERAIEADPDNAQLRLRYAEALEFLGRSDQAAEQWAATGRLSGDGAERARLLAEDGRRLVSQGRFEEAVAQFREALALAPDQAAIRTELASVLGHLGRLEEAIDEFRKVVEAEPRHATARRGEIVALLLTGRYGEARVRLQEALRQFPQDAQLAHMQARLLASVPDPRVRDGALALEIAERLFKVRQDLRVRETLAMAMAAAGQFDLAVETQRAVVGEAEGLGGRDLVDDVRRKLERFEQRQVWVFSSAEEILAATAGEPSGG